MSYPMPQTRRDLLDDVARVADSPGALPPATDGDRIAIRLRALADEIALGRPARLKLMLAAAFCLRSVEEYDALQTQPKGRERAPLNPETAARLTPT